MCPIAYSSFTLSGLYAFVHSRSYGYFANLLLPTWNFELLVHGRRLRGAGGWSPKFETGEEAMLTSTDIWRKRCIKFLAGSVTFCPVAVLGFCVGGLTAWVFFWG